MDLRNGRLRSLLIILLLCTWNIVNSNKLDSKRRLPSRRRSPRQSSDSYGNEPSEDSRGYPDDTRNFISEDSRSYPTEDVRTFQNREYDDYPNQYPTDNESEQTTSIPEDLVQQYTSKFSSRVMVSLCSGVCSSVLISLIMKMVINRIYKYVVLAVSLICAGSCFSKNKANADVTEFSNALGVFFLLLMKRSQPSSFVAQFVSQAKSAMLLTARKQFPATENPWQYVYEPDREDSIDFKMWNSLIGVILVGTVTGWSVTASIPLLPGWLGALGLAGFLGYLATLKDSRGDILRFVGYSLDRYFAYLIGVSNDVLLWDKATVLSSRLFSIILRFEKRNKIIERLTFYFAKIIVILTSFFKR